jgi:starch phosphorylase
MDSMATMGIPATGYSICYELGMFRQKIVDGKQTEVADDWRTAAESWLVPRYDEAVEVRFGGQVSPHWDNYGRYHAEYTGYTAVTAVPRDMLIAGYGGKTVNTLRLWDAKSSGRAGYVPFLRGRIRQVHGKPHHGRGNNQGPLPRRRHILRARPCA